MDNPKERRRERAQRRQELLKVKRKLEGRMAKAETLIEESELEKSSIVTALASPAAALDFAALNRRLKELEDGVLKATEDWESATAELEPVQLEYDNIHE